jgi:hypothetical protein
MAEPERSRGGPGHAGSLPVEEVAERAARLGTTLERVVQELCSIAYADITRIVNWDTETLTMTPSGKLEPTETAAIAEIVASAKDKAIYRVKMLDKTPALALLLRWLDKHETVKGGASDDDDDGEDPREFLVREIARLRARRGAVGGGAPKHAEDEGSEAPGQLGVLATP